jgi:DNA replication protein DnaC
MTRVTFSAAAILAAARPAPPGPKMTEDQALAFTRSAGFQPVHLAGLAQLDDPTPAQADDLKRTRRRLADGRVTIWTGPRGVGKTQRAAELVQRWHIGGMRSRGPARYYRWADLLNTQRAWFRDPHLKREYPQPEPLDAARDAGLLILDELHEAIDRAFEIHTLTDLIDRRYGHHRGTLLIANTRAERAALAAVFGPSVVSRTDEGLGGVVDCSRWPEMRSRVGRDDEPAGLIGPERA